MTVSSLLGKPAGDARMELGLVLFPSACVNRARFGHRGDGGWDVCLDGHAPGECTVYSAGTFDDPSFDVAIGAHGCHVHAFDPSLEQLGFSSTIKALQSNPNITFHAVGLGGRDLVHPAGAAPWQFPGLGYGRFPNDKAWTLRTIESLMRTLNHSRIDVLKVDIEGAEWPLLERILSDRRARRRLRSGTLFRQILIEVHFLPSVEDFQTFSRLSVPRSPSGLLERWGLLAPPRYPVPTTDDAIAFNVHALDILGQLQASGFSLFSQHVNVHSPYMAAYADQPKIFSCFELGFVWKRPRSRWPLRSSAKPRRSFGGAGSVGQGRRGEQVEMPRAVGV